MELNNEGNKLVDVIDAVREIDSDAADYLENEAPKLDTWFSDNDDHLDFMFTWADTPQGHDYWENIFIELIDG